MIVHQVSIYCLSLFLAAVRVQYPSATESQINSKIDAFLAQSGDRWGRRERALKARASSNRQCSRHLTWQS